MVETDRSERGEPDIEFFFHMMQPYLWSWYWNLEGGDDASRSVVQEAKF
jgi:hypothetical protein